MRMRKKKHSAERIAACSDFLIGDPALFYGRSRDIFGNDAPILLEIGCGKGDFALGLAERNENSNVIAVERIPDVAMFALEKAKTDFERRKASREAEENGGAAPVRDNLRVLIGNADYLSDWFAPGTFSGLYINFCDPWPKKGYYKRRLTAPGFLAMYRKILKPGSILEFKTDHGELFSWSLEQFAAAGFEILKISEDLHGEADLSFNIETEHERKFSAEGKPICFARVRITSGGEG
ncbi:MAG: tRNA (guanosine(46)-N7)-methyltransferase TrmB [Clostridia bacterium]|nr:tRNA (guanosine(46)-N7)-methyltransferase TrmB [Clostridia bacterium]